jgi:hypothetical protein
VGVFDTFSSPRLPIDLPKRMKAQLRRPLNCSEDEPQNEPCHFQLLSGLPQFSTHRRIRRMHYTVVTDTNTPQQCPGISGNRITRIAVAEHFLSAPEARTKQSAIVATQYGPSFVAGTHYASSDISGDAI